MDGEDITSGNSSEYLDGSTKDYKSIREASLDELIGILITVINLLKTKTYTRGKIDLDLLNLLLHYFNTVPGVKSYRNVSRINPVDINSFIPTGSYVEPFTNLMQHDKKESYEMDPKPALTRVSYSNTLEQKFRYGLHHENYNSSSQMPSADLYNGFEGIIVKDLLGGTLKR